VPISPLTELLLFAAERAQHVDAVIRPALAAGKVVICDRFADSTTAYQGYGHGLGRELAERVNAIAVRGTMPHVTFVLDLPIEAGFARKSRVGQASLPVTGVQGLDRIEERELEYHRRVRCGYQELARLYPERVHLVDAMLPPEEMHAVIVRKVEALLANGL